MTYTWGSSSIKWGSPNVTWAGEDIDPIVPLRYQTYSTEAYTLVNGLPRATADLSRPPVAVMSSSGPSGYWRMFAYLANGTKIDITKVRGAPTQLGTLTTTDPFGPAAATLTFPAVTILDTIGSGDLNWLNAEFDVDIVWVNADPSWGAVGSYRYVWEGFFTSFEFESGEGGSGLTVSCRGSLFQMDNYLAKPEFLTRPIPYEHAIRRQFLDPQQGYTVKRPDLRLANPTLVSAAFPTAWTKTFSLSAYDSANAPWTVPSSVTAGDKWTGLVTRETGNWEPVLTGYIQGLLTNMQFSTSNGATTPTGQFTLLLDTGRVPSLKFRPYITSTTQTPLIGGSVLKVDLTWPGVSMQATRDYSQRASVVYAQGQAKDGEVYSGMQVSYGGDLTFYDPAAYDSAVHPQLPSNASKDYTKMRKEVKVDFGEGLTPKQAKEAATAYLNRFSEPGTTGTITLETDPISISTGLPFPRQIIQAGSTIQVTNALSSSGVLFHVTEATTSGEGVTTLTVDSKYRDQLTVDQVRLRGRDSLIPFRSISTAGTYTPKVPDLLYPWTYGSGAGIIPEWREDPSTSVDLGLFYYAKQELTTNPGAWGFTDVAEQVEFPWTEYTKIYKPSLYPRYYIKIPASKIGINSISAPSAGVVTVTLNGPHGIANPVTAAITSIATTNTVSVTSIAQVSSVWTVTTPVAHGLAIGAKVTISGNSATANNKEFTVATVPSVTTFTVASAVAGTGGLLTKSTSISTVTTSVEHHLMAGDQVTIAGNSAALNNNVQYVYKRLSPYKYTFIGGATGTGGTSSTIAAKVKISGNSASQYNSGLKTVISTPSSTSLTIAGTASGTGGILSLANSNYNWSQRNYDSGITRARNVEAYTAGHAYRVKLSAKGDIRMIQFAAYDADGNVKPVSFHVSFYGFSGVTYDKMPTIPAGATMPPGVMTVHSYTNGQHYPFFAEAWEKINPNGTVPTNTDQLVAADGGSFLAGWGTYYERAGHWPGSSANGDAATGLLQDEVGFSWDFTNDPSRINAQKAYSDQPDANVWAHVMVYCDDSDTDTYFLGRLWNKPYQA